MKQGFVYILANRRNGTLYTGVTSDLSRRISEHQNKTIDGFTKKYGIHRLVYYEIHESIEDAIHREKCVKEWKRVWKIKTIEAFNPTWKDLSLDIAA
jgi:putative endonuclease